MAPPLLVQVVGGNVVTAAAVLACLNTADTTVLRRLHPVFPAAVAAVPWADTTIAVRDVDRWRAALPAATGLKLAADALGPYCYGRELAALGGVMELDLSVCGDSVTDDVIARLPHTLRTLNVSECRDVTQYASFTHLSALETLDCSRTNAVAAGLARLPPFLRELHMHRCKTPDTADFSHLRDLRIVARTQVSQPFSAATVASLPPSVEVLDIGNEAHYGNSTGKPWPRGWSAGHLTRLRVLNAQYTHIDGAAIATLPPSLRVLNLESFIKHSFEASFAHLASLHTLCLRYAPISAALLATLPPSLVSLDLHRGCALPPDAVFPYLPALRVLIINHATFGDATVASLPAGLEELHMEGCSNVTPRARLDHLPALRMLQSAGTALSRTTVVACRARGCFVPADGKLRERDGIRLLVSLPGGRLVSMGRKLTLWDSTTGCKAVAQMDLRDLFVWALAGLPDGHRVAAGTSTGKTHFCIVVWDTRGDKRTTIPCESGVRELAVACNGHLVAGCVNGSLLVVDVDAGVVVATLKAHDKAVRAVAALLDGKVASVPFQCRSVSLWDVGVGTCVSTLLGHTGYITSLVVLPDGRLASGGLDNTVRLWDTVSDTCIRVLTGHTGRVHELTVLPGNRLASTSTDNTIRVWDTRDEAGGAGGALARPPLVIAFGSDISLNVVAALPGNRLAAGEDSGMYLWQLPPYDVDI